MLTAIFALPIAGAILLLALPQLGPRPAKLMALAIALVDLALSLVMAQQFAGKSGFQMQENYPWIPQLGIHYHLGIDGISLWLVVLNSFLGVLALAATKVTVPRARVFLALLLITEGTMAGAFMALDLVLFYMFWEAMLIPAYLLLWLWGEGNPLRAAGKFVLFTLFGSLLMLAGIIITYFSVGKGTFDIPALMHNHLDPQIQFWLFLLFGLAFAIKVPLFPLYGWLPDAYTAAPTPLLFMLAGVMSKVGAYGFIRIALPLFPNANYYGIDWRPVVAVLAVISIVFGALLALAQRDLKRLVAYSSLSHSGFIILGLFSLTAEGVSGGVLQMVNHGLIIAALFWIVAIIEERTGSRDRQVVFGLGLRLPVLAGVFGFVTLAALGLPGLNSFVGEFMTLLGAFRVWPVLSVVGALGLILTPIYMLRLFQGAIQGERVTTELKGPDLRAAELWVLAPLMALMLFIGIYPASLVNDIGHVGQPGISASVTTPRDVAS